MAWYHVANCDCPIGCCDCGEPEKPKPPKPYDHLDMVTYELVKDGICPSCLSTEMHCECGEL